MEEEEDSILNEFLVECSEGLEQLDQEFVALEQDPTDAALLGSIFRTVHTIKGTCGFLGLPKLENVAHGAENILSAMRDCDLDVSSDGITILLESVDVIKEILEHIESERTEPNKNYDAVRKGLDDFLAGGGSSSSTASAKSASTASDVAPEAPSAEEAAALEKMMADVADQQNEPEEASVSVPSEPEPAAPDYELSDVDDDLLNEFLLECSEGIERLDQEFVALEAAPGDPDLIGSIFRTVHTIKGTCGFLGFPKLENVAHGAENLLSAMRDQSMAVTSDGITILLEAVDQIKEILEHIEAERKEPAKDYGEMRQRLDAFLAQGESGAAPVESANVTPEVSAVSSEEPPESAASVPDRADSPQAPDPPAQVEKKAAKPAATSGGTKKPSIAESSIRVDVGLLDKLINMVGELVLARNQLLQQVRQQVETSPSNASSGTVQQINLITTELQDTVMKTRMQPIKNVWDKFPRVVRDLAKSNGKEIDLVMEGAGTELDKTLLEAIKDPMTHIVRNAADHGVEMPEVRAERGKSGKGTLLLKAYHEGGRIIIEISDDGAGIAVERVKSKAVEKGVISEEMADRMSDREALNLIFHPGLSTAQKVTNVSGRGVGMDVVKTNIEKIGGTVSMSSRLGEGTQMRIEIPLTLAIIPALMVTSGNEAFAIPQASLLELVRIDEESRNQIEVVRGSNFYRLRGVLLPLLSLNDVLNLPPRVFDEDEIHSRGTNIVVLKAGDHSFGLVVDTVNDSEEIVVKPLSRQLKELSYLAGATILGDGRVALILDVMGVAHEGGLTGDGHRDPGLMVEADALQDADERMETVILFSMNEEDRYAIPLSEVARLEEFDVEKIEQSAGQDVIQYRDELLPLMRLGDAIGVMTSGEDNARIPVIVFSRHEKSIGVIVGRIIDIVEAEMHVHSVTAEKVGVKGSLVIDGKATDLLDIEQLIACIVPGWMEAVAA